VKYTFDAAGAYTWKEGSTDFTPANVEDAKTAFANVADNIAARYAA